MTEEETREQFEKRQFLNILLEVLSVQSGRVRVRLSYRWSDGNVYMEDKYLEKGQTLSMIGGTV